MPYFYDTDLDFSDANYFVTGMTIESDIGTFDFASVKDMEDFADANGLDIASDLDVLYAMYNDSIY